LPSGPEPTDSPSGNWKPAATKAIEKLFDTLAALDFELVVRPRQDWKAR